jgi:hypothetical protein
MVRARPVEWTKPDAWLSVGHPARHRLLEPDAPVLYGLRREQPWHPDFDSAGVQSGAIGRLSSKLLELLLRLSRGVGASEVQDRRGSDEAIFWVTDAARKPPARLKNLILHREAGYICWHKR